jgi:glycosyltransferase involved in cell wall biosynthesis
LKVAFVAGLSDKKINQKLLPLQSLKSVDEIHLYRRTPLGGNKIIWVKMPIWAQKSRIIGDLFRMVMLTARAKEYDLIIGCHQRYHGVYAAIAGKVAHVPVIQLVITDPDWVEKGLLGKWSLTHASAIAYRGHTTLKKKRNAYGHKPSFILYNVWQPKQICANDEKTNDLLYVGAHADKKNIPAWCRVVAEIKKRQGKIRAVMVGDKPNRKIASLIDRLGLNDSIEFTGPLYGKALMAYYTTTRVFLLTSDYEGLPMVVLEAMVHGLPIVATAVGDMEDLVKHGINGYLIRVNDIENAAAGVIKILNDEKRYNQMSKNARKSAQNMLSVSTVEHVAEEWKKVFIEMGIGDSES